MPGPSPHGGPHMTYKHPIRRLAHHTRRVSEQRSAMELSTASRFANVHQRLTKRASPLVPTFTSRQALWIRPFPETHPSAGVSSCYDTSQTYFEINQESWHTDPAHPQHSQNL